PAEAGEIGTVLRRQEAPPGAALLLAGALRAGQGPGDGRTPRQWQTLRQGRQGQLPQAGSEPQAQGPEGTDGEDRQGRPPAGDGRRDRYERQSLEAEASFDQIALVETGEKDVGVGDQRRGDHQQDGGDENQRDDELDLRRGAGRALLDRAALVAAQGD